MNSTIQQSCDTTRTQNEAQSSNSAVVQVQLAYDPNAITSTLVTELALFAALAIVVQLGFFVVAGVICLILPIELWSQVPWLKISIFPFAVLYLLLMVVIAKLPCGRNLGTHDTPGTIHFRGSILLGFTAWPMIPIAYLRHHRHDCQREKCLTTNTDLSQNRETYTQFLRLPEYLGIGILFGFGIALNGSTWIVCQHFDVLKPNLWLLLTLTSATMLPISALTESWVRTILLPEYKQWARVLPEQFEFNRQLCPRVAIPSMMVTIGTASMICCTGLLWGQELIKRDLQYKLRSETLVLVGLIHQGQTTKIGRFLQKHPRFSLRLNDQSYGNPLDFSTRSPGLSSSPTSPSILEYVHQEPKLTVVASATTPDVVPIWLMLSGGIAGFIACLLSLSACRNFSRNVDKAYAQVASCPSEDWHNKNLSDVFSSHEVSHLVQSLLRFVGRINEENSARERILSQFREAERQKSQFLANMSHDLRSPLNSILGFSELLSSGVEGSLTTPQINMVNTIQQNGRELLQQIDDILDLAKIESGRFEIQVETTPAVAIISRAIGNARQRSKQPIDYDSEIEPGLAPASVDPRRASQALENTIIFLSHRMRGGAIRIVVNRRKGSERAAVLFKVMARGCFDDLAEIHRCIEQGFSKVEAPYGLEFELPLASRIVQLHGGIFDIEIDELGMIIQLEFPDVPATPRPISPES